MDCMAKHRALFLIFLESKTENLHAKISSPQLLLFGLKMSFAPCVSRSGVSLDDLFSLLEANQCDWSRIGPKGTI